MVVKLGVIGTGAIGRDHMRRCHRVLAGARVVGVNDVDGAVARSALASLDIDAQVFVSPHELIASRDVDAIVVASWGTTHEEFVLAAIEAAKPVFCEKPLAVTAQGCRRVVDAEVARGRRLVQVGFMRPFDAGYIALKKTLDGNQIGTPLIAHCTHRNVSVPPGFSDAILVTEMLSHEVDVLRWLLDDEFVSAQVVFPRRTANAPAPLRDPQVVLLKTAKGVRVDVELFAHARYGYDIRCEIVGEFGVAELPDPPSVLLRSEARRSNALLVDWKDRFVDAYDAELRAFIDQAATGSASGPSAWDGYAAAMACDAAIGSQATLEITPIPVPLRPALYQTKRSEA